MKTNDAVLMLSALGQGTRLEAFRILMQRGSRGIAASDLSHMLEIPQQALAAHLMVLTLAGLVVARRTSQSIMYHADATRLREIVGFLLADCRDECTEWGLPAIAASSPQRALMENYA